jgi:hypothetical protein
MNWLYLVALVAGILCFAEALLRKQPRVHRLVLAIILMGVVLLVSGGFRLWHKVNVATYDSAVLNNLRNLSALADRNFAATGRTTVAFSQINPEDIRVLNLAKNVSFPATIAKGATLTATYQDGDEVHTVTYRPRN